MQYCGLSKQILEIGRRLSESAHVIGTGGNISARVRSNPELFLITPSGLPYETLRVNDMVTCHVDGHVVDGSRVPSIEFKMHAMIYKARQDVFAIIHTHSLYSTALAIAGRRLPALTTGMAVIAPEIGVAEYAMPGTEALAVNVVRALGANSAVLLANHGLVVVADNLQKALGFCEQVERGAQLYILSHIVGTPTSLTLRQCRELKKHLSKIYGQKGRGSDGQKGKNSSSH